MFKNMKVFILLEVMRSKMTNQKWSIFASLLMSAKRISLDQKIWKNMKSFIEWTICAKLVDKNVRPLHSWNAIKGSTQARTYELEDCYWACVLAFSAKWAKLAGKAVGRPFKQFLQCYQFLLKRVKAREHGKAFS